MNKISICPICNSPLIQFKTTETATECVCDRGCYDCWYDTYSYPYKEFLYSESVSTEYGTLDDSVLNKHPILFKDGNIYQYNYNFDIKDKCARDKALKEFVKWNKLKAFQ